MGGVKKKIEDLMSAVSFAEEGEFEAARGFLKRDRRILLAVRKGQVDRKTFRYAMNTCRRIGASLDVLYIASGDAPDPELDERLAELTAEGLEYRLVRKGGCLRQEIVEYTTAKKDVVFAVTESSEHLDAGCRGKGGLSEAWQKMKCPLVVVADSLSGS